MSILNEVLRYKEYKDAQDTQRANAIPQAINSFLSASQQAQQMQNQSLLTQISAAKSGFRIENGQLVRDNSLEDPISSFLKQGKIANAYNQLMTAGFISPSSSGTPNQPQPSDPAQPQLPNTPQISSPSAPQATNGKQVESDSEPDAFVTQATLNVAGVPTSTTVKSESGLKRELGLKKESSKQAKLGEAEAKVESAASEQSKTGFRFVQQYERSFDEIQKKIPGFGETGVAGKAKRTGASVLNMLDELPETSTLVDSAEVFANRMVKSDEGGKITDKDRAVYAKVLVSTLAAPSDKNARLASNELISLADRGAGIEDNLVAFSSSKNPTLQKIYSQVIEQYPELKVVKVRNSETGEEKTLTLKQARSLRGAK